MRLKRIAGWLAPPVLLLLVGLTLQGAAYLRLLPLGLPGPGQVLLELIQNGGIYLPHLRATAVTATAGYAIGVLTAFSLGFAITVFRWMETTLVTLATILNAIPIIALAPILMIWLGVGQTTRILLAAILCFFPLLVGTLQGLDTAGERLRDLFHVVAASKSQQFWKLLVPSALPHVFLALKVAAPLAILGSLVGEWTGAEEGLGALMINAMFNYQILQLWGSVTVICVFSAAAYGAMALTERMAIRDRERMGG